jgi:hypothetical protein
LLLLGIAFFDRREQNIRPTLQTLRLIRFVESLSFSAPRSVSNPMLLALVKKLRKFVLMVRLFPSGLGILGAALLCPDPSQHAFRLLLSFRLLLASFFVFVVGGGRNWTPQTKSRNVEKQSRARETLPPWTPHAETHPLRHVQEAPFPYAGKTLPKAHPHVAFYRCLGGGVCPCPPSSSYCGGIAHHDDDDDSP